MTQPQFKSPYKKVITHFPSGVEAFLLAVDQNFAVSNQDIDVIAELCNQTAIYELLFKDKLEGKPYPREKAAGFIDWARKGWQDNSHFVFLLRDATGEISAAVDIKSPNLAEAEIGYWADANKPGYMTNIIAAVV